MIDLSMYKTPPPDNSLLALFQLLSYQPKGRGNALLPDLPGEANANSGTPAVRPTAAYVPPDRRSVANTITDELRAAGLSDNGIRGILANVQDESGFNPGLAHFDQPDPRFRGTEAANAHGLYQEGGDEWNNYTRWLSKNAPGHAWSDPQLQTRYLAQNLQQNYPGVWKSLNTGSAETGAQAFVNGYLKPRADHAARRSAQYAQGIPALSDYTGGQ
jgi:hypothetical protein